MVQERWNDGRPDVWNNRDKFLPVNWFLQNEPISPITDEAEIKAWQEKIRVVEEAIGDNVNPTIPGISKNDFSGTFAIEGVSWNFRVWPASFGRTLTVRETNGSLGSYKVWIPTLLTNIESQEQYTRARHISHVYGRAIESVVVRKAWAKMEGARR